MTGTNSDLVGDVELECTDLESYPDFLRNTKNVGKHGVYIWGFRFVNPKTAHTSEFIPYYVGKARANIHRRIQKHVFDIREGTHKILRRELLLAKDCRNYFRSQKPEDHVYLHRHPDKSGPDKPLKKCLSPEERTLLIPHIECYIDNLYVSYIDVKSLGMAKEQEGRYVDILEKHIQVKIGLKYLSCWAGARIPESFKKPIIHLGKGVEHIFSPEGDRC